MFDEIEKIFNEFIECDLGIHKTFSDTDHDEAINLYWKNLSHDKRVQFLTDFLHCYFYYPIEWKIFEQKPNFPKLSELKRMQIIYEEFSIIIKLILKNNLSGRNIEEILFATRKEGFDDDFKEILDKYPKILTFMPKSFCTQLINGNFKDTNLNIQNEVIFNQKLMNTVKSHEELIEKIEYYIYIAYYHFICKYTNTQIVRVINDNLGSAVLKYNSDIKRILQEKNKKTFFRQLIKKPKFI